MVTAFFGFALLFFIDIGWRKRYFACDDAALTSGFTVVMQLQTPLSVITMRSHKLTSPTA
jgi:hypothetical protein